ncbi:p21-C-terminal region-binding protein-domain-containing protein, partial [Gautieria morchelliformis]
SLVDVDFEFFDPNPTDYMALKRLLAQLFQSDAELLHLHEFSELILSQPLVGTTVKTDGRESDPYAFLTVLNMAVHKDTPAIKTLISYVLDKAAASSTLQSTLQTLLSSPEHVGFVFSERLINMPVQLVPPMYRMLSDEIKWANEENEPYTFSHYLFITRTYRLSPEDESAMDGVEITGPPAKRPRKKKAVHVSNEGGKAATFSFHPEDEHIQNFASHTLDYEFTNSQPREQDSFGLDMAARMMLVPADRLPALVEAMGEAYAAPS